MYISLYMIAGFIGSLFLIGFTLLYLMYLYYREREFDKEQKDVYQKSSKILEHAHERAKSIIENSTERAKDILIDAQITKEAISQDTQQLIDSINEHNKEKFIEMSSDMTTQYLALFDSIKNDFSKKADEILSAFSQKEEEEISDFQKSLKQQTITSQEFIAKKINDEFDKALSEIAKYKASQIEKVRSQINVIIQKTVEDVIGQTLDVEKHEKLILDALDKAKSEGFFKDGA